MEVKKLIDNYEQAMIKDLQRLIAINSVEGKPEEDAPFGKGPKEALLAALDECNQLGFKTTNVDNYAGYAEMGAGDKLIGIVAHLDVVPVGDGWHTNPFEGIIKDNVIYGRGVSDDKGAAVASMYAMKIVKDLNIPLTKRIRLILGTNEESGSKCLAYYVSKEGHIDYGFTPDGEFPGVHGEKGMLAGIYHSKQTNIKNIKGGSAGNIVCDLCTIEIAKNSYSCKTLEDYFNNHNLEFKVMEKEDTAVIEVKGIAAHASTPDLGINAISHLLVGLKQAGYQDPFVDYYVNRFGVGNNGEGIGLNIADEFGALTLNTGVIKMEDGVISGTIDVRFPVTYTIKKIKELVNDYLDDENGYIEITKLIEPLFFPIDSPLVSTLYNAYKNVTHDEVNKPMTMGGGTYAKGINNCIAFGCAFPDMNYHIHDANEFLPIEHLKKQVEIYVEAIIRLLEV